MKRVGLMNAISSLAINGRFLTRPPTGVDRTAYELTRALSDLLAHRGYPQVKILVHKGAPLRTQLPKEMPVEQIGSVEGKNGAWWEQTQLSALPNDQMLLNLCNSGPAFRSRQAIMIHDAQVWSSPDSYTFAFRNWYRCLLPILARRADVVFTVSDFSRRALEQFGVIAKGKAKVIPNGADHILRIEPDRSILTRFGLQPRGYFLAIASNHKHKNIALLERLSTDMPIVLAGAAERSVNGNLMSVGRVSEGELRALYASAQALLFPSLTEGFGLPALEAMALGTPVVSSTGGALPETCGKAALFADPMDVDQWDAAIQRLNASPQLWDELSAAGRKHSANYTWARSADLIWHHLSQTCGFIR